LAKSKNVAIVKDPPKLAIVIPAFKIAFLKKALDSISNQTIKDFNLYIGDDNSPYDLQTVIDNFDFLIPVTYKKFDDNIGKQSLVKSWERCISLSNREPWIWLFADDDMMGTDCVESFYEISPKTENVYRFNIALIDESDAILEKVDYPELEESNEFLVSKLEYRYNSCMSNIIFSRQSYETSEGFVDFPLGWGSDDASILKFAEKGQIVTMHGGNVFWRQSSENISANMSKQILVKKFHARELYLKWLIVHKKDFLNTSKKANSIIRDWIFHAFEVELNWVSMPRKIIVLSRLSKIIGLRFCTFIIGVYFKRLGASTKKTLNKLVKSF
jgi:glycosyltransferase involved in cell wall biosynthesis